MTSTNDITGDAILSRSSTDAYREGWDRIFGKKKGVETLADCLSYPCEQCGQPWNDCGCDQNEDDDNAW